MNIEYIGKIVNTHGLKGEIRILSNFKFKKDVFKINNKIYINNLEYTIKSYRFHKIYDMVTLENINNIDDALKLKGLKVYIKKENYKFDGYLDSELIGLDVYDNDKLTGKVVDIFKTNKDDLLVIDGIKRHMVPNIKEFIKKVDLNNNKIEINYIKGLYDEN